MVFPAGQVLLEPEQTAAAVNLDVVALQVAGAHWAVEFWQFPLPSHVLVTPHMVLSVIFELQPVSVLPAAIGEQLPIPLRLHALQAAHIEVPQQTLSTQKPLMHSLPIMQAAPLALSTGGGAQVFAWHVLPLTQSASVVHAVLHELGPQTYGEQGIPVAVAQLPLPLHVDEGVKVDPVQLCDPHETFVSACSQVPLPVQFPVLPHGMLLETAQLPCNAGCPDGMLVQVPALPETLQDWQVPHDGDAQQTPSTQVSPSPLKQGLVALQL